MSSFCRNCRSGLVIYVSGRAEDRVVVAPPSKTKFELAGCKILSWLPLLQILSWEQPGEKNLREGMGSWTGLLYCSALNVITQSL